MRILWIEDFNHSEVSKEVEDKWRERYKLPREDVILKRTLTDALDYIDKSYEDGEYFDSFDLVVLDINLELGEEIEGKDYRDYLRGVLSDEFISMEEEEASKIAGFFVFLKLILDKDFPRERIAFLTSSYQVDTINRTLDELSRIIKKYNNLESIKNKNSKEYEEVEKHVRALKDIEGIDGEKLDNCTVLSRDNLLNFLKELRHNINSSKELSDAYNRYEDIFESAGIMPPRPYLKEQEEYIENFKKWVEEKNSDYYVLRRGIIEICRELKKLLKEKKEKMIIFKDFVHPRTPVDKKDMYSTSYFYEMLSYIQRILPIKEPNNKESYYKQIIRSVSHDFETIVSIYPYNFSKEEYEKNFLPVIKLLRNWTAHSRVEEEFKERDVATLFIIAMRSFFDIGFNFKIDIETSLGRINYFEKTLINFWNDFQTIDENMLSQENIRNTLKESFNSITKREYKAYAGSEKWRWSESATFNVYKKYEVIGGQNSNEKCLIEDFYRLLFHSIFYSTWEDYRKDSEDYTYLKIHFNLEKVIPFIDKENNIISIIFKAIFYKIMK